MRQLASRQRLLVLLIAAATLSPYATVRCSAQGGFQPPVAPSETLRRFDQFDALVEDRLWDEAIDLIETLQLEHGETLYEPAPDRFLPVGWECQRRLCGLPTEGLIAYRRRTDSAAERDYQGGRRTLDRRRLERVASEMLASSYGNLAVLALSEIALSAGQTTEARRWLSLADPQVSGPDGEPAACTLATVDPSVDPAIFAERWRSAERHTCSAPGGDAASAALARVAVCSLRDGDPRRARLETGLLGLLDSEAEGRIAGRRQRIVPVLRSLAAAVSSSAMPSVATRSEADRLPALPYWSWRERVSPRGRQPRGLTRAQLRMRRLQMQQLAVLGRLPAGAGRGPRVRPSVGRNSIVWTQGGGLRTLDAKTGEPLAIPFPSDLVGDQTDELAAKQNGRQPQVFGGRGGIVIRGGRVRVLNNELRVPARPAPRTLYWIGQPVFAGDTLYCRLNRQTTTQIQPRRRQTLTRELLVGLELASDAKTVFELDATDLDDEQPFTFFTSPTVSEDRLYVFAGPRTDRGSLWLYCFDRATQQRLWRTRLGSGDALGPSATPPGIASHETAAYCVTGSGAVVAIDGDSGAIRWATRYPRVIGGAATVPQLKPIVRSGILYTAPADAGSIFAFRAADGAPIWATPHEGETVPRLVAAGDSLLAAGDRLRWLDPLTGSPTRSWPESLHAGIRGSGWPAVAGGEVYWPTRDTVYCASVAGGGIARTPIDLRALDTQGADLYPTPAGLLVVTTDNLLLRGEAPGKPEPTLVWGRPTESGDPHPLATLR